MKVYGKGEKIDPTDELLQGDALIRANFKVETSTLTPEKWARLFSEAVWLENERLKNLAEMLAEMWNGQGKAT